MTGGTKKEEDFFSPAAQKDPEITDALIRLTWLNQSRGRRDAALSDARPGRDACESAWLNGRDGAECVITH